ncbi:MAG TPA: hypothetical protein VLE47_04215 [Candidatus Saccharimonadales bacterium]|nr:hypothetical protein [Candidatus Saccharimonadales bacterium]
MDYDDEYGAPGQNPRDTKVISLRDYGEATKGKFDNFCRENVAKRAVTTRIEDRDIPFNWGRGGNTVYLDMETGEPVTYEGDWTFKEKAFTDQRTGKITLIQEVEYERALNVFVCDLWDPEIVGTPFARAPWDSSRVRVLSEEEVEHNIRLLSDDQEAREKAYMGNSADAGRRLRPLLRSSRKMVQTDELSDTLPQEERRNHHMESRLKDHRKLRELHRQRRLYPDDLVEYPMTGCSPLGRPIDDSDQTGWLDALYRSAIRQRRGKKDPLGLNQKRGRDLPPGLFYEGGKYKVRIGSLNLDGLRVLAHNAAERESRTSKECYEQLMEALVHKMVRGKVGENVDEPLEACEIMARYGEQGLRTGSSRFYEEIFNPNSDTYRIYPDDAARGRAWQRPKDPDGGYAYLPLFHRMQRILHKAYHVDPVVTPVDQYNPFWTTAQFEVRYGGQNRKDFPVTGEPYDQIQQEKAYWYTKDLHVPNRLHRHRAWLDLINGFIETNFYRTYPSEQYRFRKTLSRLFGAHDKKSFLSKMRALLKIRDLTIHVISLPIPIWRFDGRQWRLELDNSTFDYFAEGIEAFRDWVRMIAEWQQVKAMLNAFAAMNFTRVTADQGRTRDFGGIWNAVPIWQCDAFYFSWLFANSRPGVKDQNGMPMFEGDKNPDGTWIYNHNFRRVWKRRAPMPVKPTRDRPSILPGETQEEWQERADLWDSKYPARPVRPTLNPGETADAFVVRLKDFIKLLGDWEKQTEDSWIADIKEYQSAINARVAIMGWAWHDRDPLADMPHDTVLRALSVYRWADWLDMIGVGRGFNSQLGDGLVSDLTTFLKEQSSKVRNYRHETEAMESDEGARYDPQGFWDYLGGIIRPHIENFLNYRLFGTFGEEPGPKFLDTLFDGTDVYNEKSTRVRNQINLMWQEAPLKGIKRRVLKVWDDSLSDHVIHIRPLIRRFLDGLPVGVLDRLQPLIRGLNRRSDRRIREWAQHLSVGRTHGKRAFTTAQRFIDEGYGTNTGEQLEEIENGQPRLLTVAESEQKRQDDLGFTTWMNSQYDKASYFIKGLIIRERNKAWVDSGEGAEHVIKAIESGLYHEIAYEILEIASHRGLILKSIDWFPSLDEFRKMYKETGLEDKFEDRCKALLGTAEFRAVIEGYLFPDMKAAIDPLAA